METNSELKTELELYLHDLETTQAHMTDLMQQQQIRLVSPNPEELVEFNSRGTQALATFQNLVERRAKLLSRAQSCGYTVQNLEELARRLGFDRALAKRFQKLKHQSDLLMRTSFSQWVACQKATLHCRQLIQIIANGGRQTLQSASGKGRSPGGAILDASV